MVWSALLRPSNLAIACALARGGFGARLTAAAQAHPDVRLHLAWGSQSELVDDVALHAAIMLHGVHACRATDS